MFRRDLLMFMEYARNAVRMASLMKKRVIFVYTHDSSRPGRRRPERTSRWSN